MIYDFLIQSAIVIAIVCVFWLLIRCVRYLRHKNTDAELWATIFEGLTQKSVAMETLKQPQSYMEKKVKRDGQDKDSEVGQLK